MKRWSAMLVCLGLFAAACSSGGGGSGGSGVTPAQCTAGGLTVASGSVSPGPSGEAPVTLNIWSFYTGREFKQYCSVLQDFHKKYPWISIQHTGGEDRPGHRASGQLRHGSRHDDQRRTRQRCEVLLQRRVQGPEPVPEGGRHRPVHDRRRSRRSRYTSYNGVQCTLPVLSDAYGLYYNTAMFKKAGITEPPKTLSRAGDGREEAHRVQPRRVDQGRRLDAAAGLLREQRALQRELDAAGSGTTTPGSRRSRPIRAGPPSCSGRRTSSRTSTAPTGTRSCSSSSRSSAVRTPSGPPRRASRPARSRWRSTVSGATRSSPTTARRSTTRRRPSRWPIDSRTSYGAGQIGGTSSGSRRTRRTRTRRGCC